MGKPENQVQIFKITGIFIHNLSTKILKRNCINKRFNTLLITVYFFKTS